MFFCSKKTWNDRITSVRWGFLYWEYYNAQTPDWTYKVNVSESSYGTLTKTGSTGWNNAGAISQTVCIDQLNPGAVEVKILQSDKEFMIGLSYDYTSDGNWNTIDLAINNSLYYSNTVRCYNHGSYVGSSSINWEAENILRVERHSSNINFFLNSIPILQMVNDYTQKLYIDCALGQNGTILYSAS